MANSDMRRRTWIKICGVTLPQDVELVCAAGADAVGLNFIARSRRCIDLERARMLAQIAKGKLECVGVVEDLDENQIRALMERVGLDSVQLHGSESTTLVERLGCKAYKAVGIGTHADVKVAESLSGERVLVDARIGELVGGTGTTFDWSLVETLCKARPIIVAGGLHPGNVADAVQRLLPYGVDVASGVEHAGQPGVKSPQLVRRFVDEVRRIDAQ